MPVPEVAVLTCTKYQKTLRCLCSRHTSKEEDRVGSSRMSSAVSHVNYRYLPTPEKDERLRELHSQHRNTMKHLERVQQKLVLAIKENGILIDESMNGDLTKIMNECADKVTAEHPVGSLTRVFWDQQLKAASCKDQRQMRWHPLTVTWCLYLRHQSAPRMRQYVNQDVYRKVWLISACAYFVSGKKLCAYYMYALITRMRLLRVCKTHVRRIQGPAQPKHYRTAMRAFLPTPVLY